MKNKLNILITGASGLIGQSLAYKLLSDKHNVILSDINHKNNTIFKFWIMDCLKENTKLITKLNSEIKVLYSLWLSEIPSMNLERDIVIKTIIK